MTPLIRRFGAWIACIGVVLGGLLVPMAAHAGNPVITFAQAFGSSSIAVNASTSLTFTVSNGLGATPALNGSFTDTLPAGLVVATPNGLTGTCLNNPQNAVVTATAGSGTISLSGMYLGASSSCTLSVNVTGTTEGSKTNAAQSFVYNSGSALSNSASLTVTAAAAPTPTQPIPNRDPATPSTGIGTQPTTVDLSKGQGPDMTACMMNAVKAMPGFGQAVYLGQDRFGVASIDLKDGRYLSFYPLAATTDVSRAPGLYFSNTNKSSLVTSCGSFDIAPAVYNLAALGALFNAQFSVAGNISPDGVSTFVQGDTTYVFRPDFFVARGTSGGSSLTPRGTTYAFSDGAGDTQLMFAAFADPTGVAGVISGSSAGPGVMSILADGTATYTKVDGSRWLLTPDFVMKPVPQAYANALVWADSVANYYWVRVNTLLMAQRFKAVLLP